MATQTWLNLASDPKVQEYPGNPALSRYWVGSYGGSPTGGSGGLLDIQTSGGPAASARYGTYPIAAGALYGTIGTGQFAIPTGVSETKTIGLWLRTSMQVSSLILRVFGYDSSDNTLGDFFTPALPTFAPNEWVLRTAVTQVPQSWVKVTISAYYTMNGSAGAGSFDATAALVVPAVDGAAYSGPYFDGDVADVPDVAIYSWLGTPEQSASQLVLTIPDPTASTQSSSASAVPVPNPVIPRVLKPLYLKDFSVQEDSTPIYASDMTGGAGTMTLQVDENGDTPYLLDAEIDLVDPAQGTTRGAIRNLSSDNAEATLTADSRVALLNVTRQAAVVDGTFEDAVEYYLGLCGITDGYVVDASIAALPVIFLGFDGNVMEEIKKFCPALGVEMSLVSNNIVFRPVRGRASENYRDSSRSWSYDTSQKAQRVDIYQYTVSTVTNGLIYNGYDAEQASLSVEAGVTAEFTIPVDGSIISLDQPVYTVNIGPGDPGFSAYNAIGNDNLPITPEQWEAQGGRLAVAASDDSRSIIVTVTAPNEPQYSPYRIGVSDGDTVYSTLRLHGSAVLYAKELKSFHTAVDPDRVSQEVGATIDSPYIQSDQQVLDVAMGELRYWGGNRRTINVETRGINRLSDNGSYAYAEFAGFDAWWDSAFPGATFADFDTNAPATFGNTFGEHDAWWIEEVQSDFANQAFGNIAGARVYTDYNVHRIRTATTTPRSITYVAWEDSVFSDHDALWGAALPGATFADFDTHWYGRAFVEFDATPLEAVDG